MFAINFFILMPKNINLETWKHPQKLCKFTIVGNIRCGLLDYPQLRFFTIFNFEYHPLISIYLLPRILFSIIA